MFEVIDDWEVFGELKRVWQWGAAVNEAAQFGVEFALAGGALGGIGFVIERAIEFAADWVAVSGEAEEDESGLAAEGFEEGIDDGRGMAGGEMIFGGGAEISDTGRFGSIPALAIVDAPGMDHDESGLGGLEVIGDFDDAAGIVTPAPGSHMEIGVRVINERRSFPSAGLADRFDPFGMISEQWFGVADGNELVWVGASGIGGARRGGIRRS